MAPSGAIFVYLSESEYRTVLIHSLRKFLYRNRESRSHSSIMLYQRSTILVTLQEKTVAGCGKKRFHIEAYPERQIHSRSKILPCLGRLATETMYNPRLTGAQLLSQPHDNILPFDNMQHKRLTHRLGKGYMSPEHKLLQRCRCRTPQQIHPTLAHSLHNRRECGIFHRMHSLFPSLANIPRMDTHRCKLHPDGERGTAIEDKPSVVVRHTMAMDICQQHSYSILRTTTSS